MLDYVLRIKLLNACINVILSKVGILKKIAIKKSLVLLCIKIARTGRKFKPFFFPAVFAKALKRQTFHIEPGVQYLCSIRQASSAVEVG